MKVRALRSILLLAITASNPSAPAQDDILDPRFKLDPRINTQVLLIRPDPTPRPGDRPLRPEETLTSFRVSKLDGEWLEIASRPRPRAWVRADETIPVDRAIAFFARKLEQTPNDPDLLARQGGALRSQGKDRGGEAVASYDRAIQLDPQRAYLYHARSRLGGSSPKELERAMVDLNHALAIEPRNPIYLESRAANLRSQKKYDEALADSNEAIRLDPTSASHYVTRGLIYKSQGKIDLALADYAESIRLGSIDGLIFRALYFNDKRQFDQAIADSDRAIQIDPTYPYLYLLRGGARRSLGQPCLAIEDYTRCLRLAPPTDAQGFSKKLQDSARASYFSYRADAYGDMGDNGLALADYTEAARLDPKNASYRANQGRYQFRLAHLDEALRHFDEALQINPKHVLSLETKAWLLASHPVDGRRDGKKALELVTLAKDQGREKTPENLATQACVHAELGDFDEAIRCQESAIQALPDGDTRLEYYQSCLTQYKNKQPHRVVDATPKVVG